MTIAFHSNQLSIRGTEVALYDYAHNAETILGHRAIIVTKASGKHDDTALQKFHQRFTVLTYQDLPDLEQQLAAAGCLAMYAIKSGDNDGLLPHGVENWVHTVFRICDPHGDVYAYVSDWLAADHRAGQGRYPAVPHMVYWDHTAVPDLRHQLGIAPEAVVIGTYGGAESFDLHFARRAVLGAAQQREDLVFLFLNTHPFGAAAQGRLRLYRSAWQDALARFGPLAKQMPNVRFLPGTADMAYKQQFIATSDAMLHARAIGESFGLAIAEFSLMNKPVMTYAAQDLDCDKAHLAMLGSKALTYADEQGLTQLLLGFKPQPEKDWNAYRDYNPEAIMQRFQNVFVHKMQR